MFWVQEILLGFWNFFNRSQAVDWCHNHLSLNIAFVHLSIISIDSNADTTSRSGTYGVDRANWYKHEGVETKPFSPRNQSRPAVAEIPKIQHNWSSPAIFHVWLRDPTVHFMTSPTKMINPNSRYTPRFSRFFPAPGPGLQIAFHTR